MTDYKILEVITLYQDMLETDDAHDLLGDAERHILTMLPKMRDFVHDGRREKEET